jgi:CO dehydrogenase/acetyl-CoA synthase gamma subunit (corrinoid Fe-S protein)
MKGNPTPVIMVLDLDLPTIQLKRRKQNMKQTQDRIEKYLTMKMTALKNTSGDYLKWYNQMKAEYDELDSILKEYKSRK